MSTNEHKPATVDAERIADAIDLIHAVRFVPGKVPDPDDDSDENHAMIAAHSLASTVAATRGKALEMRAFQKAGISSRYVARCLREGVLRAVPAEGSGMGGTSAVRTNCDACGCVVIDGHRADTEVCGDTDGPGSFLCSWGRCVARLEDLTPAERKDIYEARRRENKKR